MTYNVNFYGPKDGKRQRVGRGVVEASDAMGALKAAHDLIGKAPPDVRNRITETRVEQATAGFRWSGTGKPKTAK